MLCKLHKAAGCVTCARAALSAQVAKLLPQVKRGATEAMPPFKGRSYRSVLHEKGIV